MTRLCAVSLDTKVRNPGLAYIRVMLRAVVANGLRSCAALLERGFTATQRGTGVFQPSHLATRGTITPSAHTAEVHTADEYCHTGTHRGTGTSKPSYNATLRQIRVFLPYGSNDFVVETLTLLCVFEITPSHQTAINLISFFGYVRRFIKFFIRVKFLNHSCIGIQPCKDLIQSNRILKSILKNVARSN